MTSTLKRKEFEQQALPLMGVLYAGALKLTRDPQNAEDLVQDTYVRALEKFHLFKPGTNLKAWMYRVMMNRFINLYRRRVKRPDGVSSEGMEDLVGTEPVLDADRFQPEAEAGRLMRDARFLDSIDDRLKSGLESLSEDHRDVLILHAMGDLSYREIAETVGVPIGTVMSRLSCARESLKERVEDLAREVLPRVQGATE